MNRDEHLRWARDRAREYLDQGDFMNALASWTSDLNKHPDTQAELPTAVLIHRILILDGAQVAESELRRLLDRVLEP